MIALDTSSLSAYLSGASGEDVEWVEAALAERRAFLPAVVLTELLSTPRLRRSVADVFRGLPLLEVLDGYWERAGMLRAKIQAKGHKARLADSLIAQACLDHRMGLVTRDDDFRHFRTAGLTTIP